MESHNESVDVFACSAYSPRDARLSPLRAATEQEERKLVSVLFVDIVDIVGSTARADLADPEDVRHELRLFYERGGEQIEWFGGTAEKFIGDDVVAVFGAPLAHGDDAERASAADSESSTPSRG